jgi:hypothetical protein
LIAEFNEELQNSCYENYLTKREKSDVRRGDQFEDVGIDEAILKWALKEMEGYRQGLSGCCKNQNGLPVLEKASNYCLV